MIRFVRFATASLKALSPLDGRYQSQMIPLIDYFSEMALMKYRIRVESQWLLQLLRSGIINQSPLCSLQQLQSVLSTIHQQFNDQSAQTIKSIQQTTNHDLKSVEYYIKSQLDKTNASIYKQFVHFCCTSQDINNLSYALMLKQCLQNVIIPKLTTISNLTTHKSIEWSSHAMLARTHGQTATPTTLGKQYANFAYRISKQLIHVKNVKLSGKFNGAVGNMNSHRFVYPSINWLSICQEFVTNHLNLQFNPYTTQIQSHDSLVRVFSQLSIMNTIIIGLCRDTWEYISKSYLKQKTKSSEVGSSTMPHKVNPIDFQNCQGNLGVANGLIDHFRVKLPISRLQRDLSDSTVLRNQGITLGYSLVAYNSLQKGLNKIQSNQQFMLNQLKNHYQVITEAIQTQLRKVGYPQPYQLLKNLSRGKSFTQQSLKQLASYLKGKIPNESIQKIELLKPQNYLGYAEQLAKDIRKSNMK